MLTDLSDPSSLARSAVAGYENLAAWADLLDGINVYPVADGDTGTNLRISLSPLRQGEAPWAAVGKTLAGSGIGNSGNIAVAFLTQFLDPDRPLKEQVREGRLHAYRAVASPVSGTMLDIFEALENCLQSTPDVTALSFDQIRSDLQKAVLATPERLQTLQEAGVIDAGALGMFLFFDGFFQQLLNCAMVPTPLSELFGQQLQLAVDFRPHKSGEYCVEAVVTTSKDANGLSAKVAALGESAVVVPMEDGAKIHLHTHNPQQLKEALAALGSVERFSEESIDAQLYSPEKIRFSSSRVRILTDGAGSIPRELALEHGIQLLDSYIVTGEKALPESLCQGDELYALLKSGGKVSTAQASNRERSLQYATACDQNEQVLYICTGSAFTGNYGMAQEWLQNSGLEERFMAVDSGAASGRLAVIALLSARYAAAGHEVQAVAAFAETLSAAAKEYVFIDEMKYLVAGGRVSKTKGFFADLLHMKPVISPERDGVRKVGVVRNRQAQLAFGIEKLAEDQREQSELLILLQFSDNRKWLEAVVKPAVMEVAPNAEVQVVPLSLTSGVHMGPGTWSVAYAEK